LKRHPVPFGEFVPLRGALNFIPQLDQVPRDMVRGEGPVVFQLPDGVLGSVISFEGGFPEYLRDEVRTGAELMVVATNESTWGATAASDQFLAMTRVNAASIGQDLIHAAITGRSAFISASGDLDQVTDLLVPAVRIAEVTYRTGAPTIYARFGDLLVYLAIGAGIAAIAVPSESRPESWRRSY
jgi:apolipoprotein N-acyltransferase